MAAKMEPVPLAEQVAFESDGAAPSGLLDLLDDDDVMAAPVADGDSPSEARGTIRPMPEEDSGEQPNAKFTRVKFEKDTGAGASPGKSAGVSSLVLRQGRHSMGAPPSSSDAPSTCEGCSRIRGVSPDFIVVGETVAWAHGNGRGCWCRDCHTTWRTNFHHEHGLAYFPTWLNADVANRVIFEKCLLAFVSLTWEDQSKITRDLVLQRVSLIEWLWTTTQHDPFKEGASPTTFVREWLARLSGAPPSEQVVRAVGASPKKEDGEDGASPSKPRSRLAKRVHGMIPIAKELLAKFGNESWLDATESMFTKCVSTLSALYVECGQIGDSPATSPLVQEWSQGMQAAKLFIKASGTKYPIQITTTVT